MAIPTDGHDSRLPTIGGRRAAGGRLTGGGTQGNELLTTAVGALLIVLLAVIGLTLIRMHQLVWVHLFVGLALIGPVAVKLASTGYRFVRYYTRDPVYRRKGPPPIVLRALGPGLVATTVAVLASGIVLMLDGPARRGSWLLIHKVSFIVWGVLIAVHVLAHLPALGRVMRRPAGRPTSDPRRSTGGPDHTTGGPGRPTGGPGRPTGGPDHTTGGPGRPTGGPDHTTGGPDHTTGGLGRTLALGGGLVGGLLLATLLIPDFAAWTSGVAFRHHP